MPIIGLLLFLSSGWVLNAAALALADKVKHKSGFDCGRIQTFNWPIPDGTSQLLVVAGSTPAQMRITACYKRSGSWVRSTKINYPVTIGENGLVSPKHKQEGDLKTPIGLYELGGAFGVTQLNLKFPYRKLSAMDKFIDDPQSPEYNSWVQGPTKARSYEPLLKYYQYGIIINYNMNPVVPGKGSAIFVHNWQQHAKSTAGCVAMAEKNLLTLLNWLDYKAKPYILILGEEVFDAQRS